MKKSQPKNILLYSTKQTDLLDPPTWPGWQTPGARAGSRLAGAGLGQARGHAGGPGAGAGQATGHPGAGQTAMETDQDDQDDNEMKISRNMHMW